MKHILLLCLTVLSGFASAVAGKVPLASHDIVPKNGGDLLVSSQMVENILDYQKYGDLFTYLQAHYFRAIFLGILIGVFIVFLLHYLIVGAKSFSHSGKKVLVYSIFKRVIHWTAALAFVVIIPTGLIMVFGKELGGGTFVLYARELHAIFTVVFIVSIFPMLLFWFVDMLPTWYDIKWVFMAGGYLSKKVTEVPAGKFNAGQKMWFWVATLGGMVMIMTGAAMYFQSFDFGIASSLGLTQIDLLRAAAIVHNIFAFAVLALFITHLYMSLFAIKGSLDSMVSGYKSEDELKYMHSVFYKKLKKEGKI